MIQAPSCTAGQVWGLLNSVIASRYTQVADWVRARLRRRPTAPGGGLDATVGDTAAPAASTSGEASREAVPQWVVWPGFAAAAVIGGFVDPQFGVNWMSVRLLLTGLLSFLVLNLAGWTLVIRVFRRIQKDAAPRIRFRWASLVLVAITVLIARLLEFQPGVIFGLVAGLAFAISLTASRNALVVLLGSGFGLIVARGMGRLLADRPGRGRVARQCRRGLRGRVLQRGDDRGYLGAAARAAAPARARRCDTLRVEEVGVGALVHCGIGGFHARAADDPRCVGRDRRGLRQMGDSVRVVRGACVI